MDKARFDELKNKFTNGLGLYSFKVPVMSMENADLRDYIDYIAEKYSRAVKFDSRDAMKKQHQYIHLLHNVSKNRPDFALTEEEKEISKFQN